MTPEDNELLQQYLQAAAAILFKNTPKEELKDFTGIELAVRDHIINAVAPQIGGFFYRTALKPQQDGSEQFKPV